MRAVESLRRVVRRLRRPPATPRAAGGPPWSPPRRWRPWAVVLLLGPLAFAVTGVALYGERARTLADGERTAVQLSHVLEEQTLRTVQAVDLTLRGMASALALTPDLPDHDPAFQDTLRRWRDLLPFVRALFVVGADGFITQDTDHPHTPRVSLADRGYFRAHRDDPRLGLHIGPPLRSRSVGVWFVGMSRRLEGPDGRFRGIAVAAVEPRFFERFYEQLDLVEGDSIAIFHRDGTLYWRTPPLPGGIGQSFRHLPLFARELPAADEGVFRATGIVEPADQRIVSYRALEGLPLVVVVTLGEDRVLAGWRRAVLGGLAAAALLVALGAVVAVLLARQAREREALRQRVADAQRLEALGRMAGGVAHDFNNVLHVIATNLEAIRRTLDPVPVSVEAALRAARQGTQIAGRLLVFARRQALTIEPTDVNALLGDMLPLLRQAAGPSVEVTASLAGDAWPCLADTGEFNAAVLNLVLNARDAMGGQPGQIRIATANRRAPGGRDALGDCLRVTVADSGAGMPADVLRRAAEPFFTTKPRGVGTGLGLSQVYGFARQVGGDVRIESAPGAGTAVHLLLPRAPAGPAVPAAPRREATPA